MAQHSSCSDAELLAHSSDCVLVFGCRGQLLSVNTAGHKLLAGGQPPADLLGLSLGQLLGVPAAQAGGYLDDQLARFRREGSSVMRGTGRAGQPLALQWVAAEQQGDQLTLLLRDASASQPFRDELVALREQLQVTLFSVADAVITTDVEGRVTSINPTARSLLKVGTHSGLGVDLCHLFTLFQLESRTPLPCLVRDALGRGRLANAPAGAGLFVSGEEPMVVDAVATPFRDSRRRIAGCVLVFRNADASQRMTARMNWQATHDGLTQLPNRLQFEAELAREVARARCGNAGHGLLVVDIYQFRVINETCGQAAGDQLLVQLGELFAASLRNQDMLARLGSDEFGILLRGASLAGTQRVADSLLQSVRALSFEWEGHKPKVAVSIGAVAIDMDTESESQALVAATAASQAAREAGRNRIHLHHNLNAATVERRRNEMHWVSKLSTALAEDRLVLYGQPVVRVNQPEAPPAHYEVLVRMRDEQGGIVAPAQFLPAAERFGLMDEIDRTVLIKAIEFIERHPDSAVSLAVNLSGSTLGDESFAEFVLSEMDSARIDPARLHFEITETAAIGNFRAARKLMKNLRARGCCFYLDDFGSGLSSFGYLRDLPVDFVKIDGSFVRAMTPGSIDLAMVSSINHLAGVLGIKTVAEYVENAEVLTLLQGIGVDYAQGYHFSAPMPLDDIFPAS